VNWRREVRQEFRRSCQLRYRSIFQDAFDASQSLPLDEVKSGKHHIRFDCGIEAGQFQSCIDAVEKVFTDPRLTSIAARYRKSVSQIVLRWIIQQGVVALSRTVHEERLAENINVFNFELGADDMAAIHKLAVPNSRIVDPPGLAPVWDATT
jgi:hypothetical protein